MTVSGKDAVQLGFNGTYSYEEVRSGGYWKNDDHAGYSIYELTNDEWGIFGIESRIEDWNSIRNSSTNPMVLWLGKRKIYTPLKRFSMRTHVILIVLVSNKRSRIEN